MNYRVAQIHPALADHPHINNIPTLQGIHVSNAAGSPVNPLAVVNAEKTVEALLATNRLVPGLFADPIIETAKNRAHVFEEAIYYASLDLGVQPGIGVFVQQQFLDFDRRLARIEAMFVNEYPDTVAESTTHGDGHDLALAICGDSDAALPAAVQDYQPNAAVGDVPGQWDPNIEGYELVDILRLVIFYNEDIGNRCW
ncbi:hypothetical protein F5888DRAFT_1804983 [Russula emetica]|nr:hypothetical protein F5888DRAFT_1804983 [Russula emetica]